MWSPRFKPDINTKCEVSSSLEPVRDLNYIIYFQDYTIYLLPPFSHKKLVVLEIENVCEDGWTVPNQFRRSARIDADRDGVRVFWPKPQQIMRNRKGTQVARRKLTSTSVNVGRLPPGKNRSGPRRPWAAGETPSRPPRQAPAPGRVRVRVDHRIVDGAGLWIVPAGGV